MTLSATFAAFARDARIPADVMDRATLALLDLVGVAYAGATLPVSRIVAQHVADVGGRAEARILVTQARVPAASAAFANGVAAHALDMDDGHRQAAAHPGVAVIPAALAVAEREGAGGAELLRAVTIGYELFVRVARAINPAHLRRGFHTTSTVGPLGAAAAAAVLVGVDADVFTRALGLAGISGAGLLEVLRDGAMAKPYQTARASAAGVTAVDLAAAGLEGPRSVLDGDAGFPRAMAGDVDLGGIATGLGEEWAIRGTYFKGHAACRHTHPAIDAALELRAAGLRADEVRHIRVHTYAVAHQMCGTDTAPAGPAEAKFSLPFTVALALVRGHAGQSGFTPDTARDADLLALARRVDVVIDPELDAAYPERRGARLEVVLMDGATRTAFVPLARGEPETPFERSDLVAKFRSNVELTLDEGAARELEARILDIARAPVVPDLWAAASRTPELARR